MKKAMIGMSVLVVLLTAVSQAVAWCPLGRGIAYAPNLNLTAEQSGKLNTLKQDFFKETLPIRNELASKVMEFRALLTQPSTDAGKIKAKQKEIFALQQKLQEKSVAYHLDARKILTAEQISMLPPGCGLGFLAGAGYGSGRGYGRGYGQGMWATRGAFCGGGRGGGFGRGLRDGSGPINTTGRTRSNYVDQNGDGICDNTGAKIPGAGYSRGIGYGAGNGGRGMGFRRGVRDGTGPISRSGSGRPNYVDANGDGICDNLGVKIPKN